jgi:hypothetical protein
MKNPQVVYDKTPNGGDYSEFYMLDKSGNLAKTKEEATEFRILEKLNDGTIVKTTYGIMR